MTTISISSDFLNSRLQSQVYLLSITLIGDKVFKSKLRICGRQTLKNLLSPLLNTLSHIFCE